MMLLANFVGNAPDYSNYHAYFSPKSTHKVLGEATAIYMYWNESVKRIFQYNPEMKIIIILRNPIDRAYSQWNIERTRNTDKLSFEDTVKAESERSQEAYPHQHRVCSYIDRGYYMKQKIRRIWEYFPKDKVLIIKK